MIKGISAFILTILIFACAMKDKKDNTLLLVALYLLNEQSKKTTDTTPTCKVSVTSSGKTSVINAPFTTATSVDQNFKVQGDDIGFGVSFQYYAVIKVTTKTSGKLIFQGANNLFFPKIFADSTSCDVNYSGTSLSVGSISYATKIVTLTFSQAGTYLVPVSIILDTSDPAVFVRYSD